MGLRDTVARAAASAFAAVGDIPESVTLNRASNTYDAATGVMSATVTKFTAQAIFTSFELTETDRVVVLGEDKKAIIRQSTLATAPTLTDTLSNAAGKSHQILGVRQDPAGATWTLHIRAVS